ncbi:MAG: hypothetical protein IT292_00370 [Deltaproteobacteria bacterium]|nr:hypothetical protein [Deltaproteobacteria bacterium]
MKILLITDCKISEHLADRHQNRVRQLSDILARSQHTVRCSMPYYQFSQAEIDELNENSRNLLWSYHNQAEIIDKNKPDLAIYTAGWEHFALNDKPAIPIIIDLLYPKFHNSQINIRDLSVDNKLSALSKADKLICSDDNHRIYFYGWMLQAGRFPQHLDSIRILKERLSSSGSQDSTINDNEEDFLAIIDSLKVIPESDPARGIVYTRPSFLYPSCEQIELIVRAVNQTLEQRFVFPAETIAGLELSISEIKPELVSVLQYLSVSILNNKGKVIVKRKYSSRQLIGQNRLSLKFPIFRSPRGGELLKICISVKVFRSEPKRACFTIYGQKGVAYPLIASDAQSTMSLAVNFLPADLSKLFRYKMLFSRAFYLIRHGEYQKFYRALRRRIAR